MRFPVKLAVANATLLGAGMVIPPFAPFASTWVWVAVVCWYFGLTLLLNRWIQSAMRRSSMQFITAVNGSTAVKMFSSLALVTAYLVLVGGTYRPALGSVVLHCAHVAQPCVGTLWSGASTR